MPSSVRSAHTLVYRNLQIRINCTIEERQTMGTKGRKAAETFDQHEVLGTASTCANWCDALYQSPLSQSVYTFFHGGHCINSGSVLVLMEKLNYWFNKFYRNWRKKWGKRLSKKFKIIVLSICSPIYRITLWEKGYSTFRTKDFREIMTFSTQMHKIPGEEHVSRDGDNLYLR